MDMIRAALIGAGQRGARAYAEYAKKRPNEIAICAVAEPNDARRTQFAKEHNIPEELQFRSWEELLAQPKLAEVVLICTQDRMHYAPVMKAIEQGYNILLEKPMSPDPLETFEMAAAADKAGVQLIVCHVLRYTPFFIALKQLLEEKRIGRLVTVQWNENVGFWHQAHSFVRGNWRNSKESSPMILAKSCHDMDAIQWLVDDECDRLSSYGGLTYFNEANAPEGSTERCTDGCAVEAECPYSALKVYYNELNKWPQNVVSEPKLESRMKAIQEGPYGRCVYRCDNDVVDHQVVNLRFRQGVTVAFTMTAFTNESTRTLKLMGTEGEIRASLEKNEIDVIRFDGRKERITPAKSEGGHSGGDFKIMQQFVRILNGGAAPADISSAHVSANSHLLAFAAELSRTSGQTIVMEDYINGLKQQL
jgi:predicted dehydrogenase